MSHYAVVVFSDKPYESEFDRLMEPYNECDKRYYEFHPVSYEDIFQAFKRFHKDNPEWTLEMYIEDNHYIQENGQWGYKCNPNGYYDYYTLDGKSYLYDLKPEQDIENYDFDFYRKHHINWLYIDKSELKKCSEFWDNFVAKKQRTESLFSREYYLERYKTKEQYLYEQQYTVPYAFVTPDGIWHAPGRVGWFATSDETAESFTAYLKEWIAYIKDETSDPFVSILDCHI